MVKGGGQELMAEKRKPNCFDEFKDISPKKKDPTIQVLYEYEKHYLEMIRKYGEEIKFIQDLLQEYRKEYKTFYETTLPQVKKKLMEDVCIDEEMKRVWLNRFITNVERSFGLSETLINDYAIKNLDEFKKAVNEKLRSI